MFLWKFTALGIISRSFSLLVDLNDFQLKRTHGTTTRNRRLLCVQRETTQ